MQRQQRATIVPTCSAISRSNVNKSAKLVVINIMNILRTSARTRNNSAALEREKGVPEANYKNEYAFGKDRHVEHIEAELLIAVVLKLRV